MPIDIVMPALGMAQETGTLVRLLRQQGESVTKGEALMEVETDKAVVAIEAPATGILGQLLIAEGETVPVGEVIGHILMHGEVEPQRMAASAEPAESPPSPHQTNQSVGYASEDVAANEVRVQASPKARQLAKELGLELGMVRGTGPGGTVLAADLDQINVGAGASLPVGSGGSNRSRMWKLMAERSTTSWTTAPHFFLSRKVDASRLVSWHSAAKAGGSKATYTDLLVSLVAACLKHHPNMNASFYGGEGHQHTDVNISLAIAVDDGLVTPVIHGADLLGIDLIAEARRGLVNKARAGRLALSDLQGGTFTISNLGMHGVDSFNAVLNEGQAGILAVGRIVDDVVAVSGQPEVRPRMAIGLSCDHRLVDGVRAARFLEELAALIENLKQG